MTVTTTDPRIKKVKYITEKAGTQDIKTILAKLNWIIHKMKTNEKKQ